MFRRLTRPRNKNPILRLPVRSVRFPFPSRPTHRMSDHYDVIIIGTGAGGGTLLNKLAPSGKRILVLERGPFLPREKENWDTKIAFNTTRYFGPEVWYDKNGGEVRAGMCYHVGGNTKLYGAALFRLRERDFERVQHAGGVSPEWPLKYRTPRSFIRFTAKAVLIPRSRRAVANFLTRR